ncbi:MAG: cyclomaltodextrinase N-terminal domain-containing protein, partial [Ignavibacteriae bacterium]|nr:cyclomaltodextrinase N-terminal domain-containing protein [Ignavibacteriota bacterium]
MKWNRLQLMLYGEHLDNVGVVSQDPGLRVLAVHEIANSSYAFIDVEIGENLDAGEYVLSLEKADGKESISFILLQREDPSGRFQGFDQRDIIYLITTDRFTNGDTTNDEIQGMSEGLDRTNPYGRHGGDIQGIIDKLDYIKDLGVTTIWNQPLVENNGRTSYHGYAVTDMYRIDPRFGTNALFKRFVDEAHSRGLKVIMDHVNNHIGINHPWIKNLPTADWLNGSVEDHQPPYHGKIELHDIHSDSGTRSKATHGWFTDYMPDLNQKNPLVKNYLIQNTLWWIQFSGLDGIRDDTYPYADQEFLSEWCMALLTEYPNFNIVGEVWIQDPAFLAPYQRGSHLPKAFDTNLPSITDFGLYDAFVKVFGSGESISTIHRALAHDFLFPDAEGLVTFLDNHDTRRIMHRVNGDVRRFKLALQLLLTTRGIPQIYYGTEIGMMGGSDHGRIRADFPGGFPGDRRDAFTATGRTAEENGIFQFLKELIALRRSHEALMQG